MLPESMSGIGHLWFLTVIMLCYLLLILVKKSESTDFVKNIKKILKSKSCAVFLSLRHR